MGGCEVKRSCVSIFALSRRAGTYGIVVMRSDVDVRPGGALFHVMCCMCFSAGLVHRE